MKNCRQTCFLVLSVLLSGCTSVGDYYRVDRLLSHVKQGNSVEGCRNDVSGGRSVDCDETIPPINLDEYTFPGEKVPAYYSVSTCGAREVSVQVVRASTITAIRSLTSATQLSYSEAANVLKSLSAGFPDVETRIRNGFALIADNFSAATKELDAVAGMGLSPEWVALPVAVQGINAVNGESIVIISGMAQLTAAIEEALKKTQEPDEQKKFREQGEQLKIAGKYLDRASAELGTLRSFVAGDVDQCRALRNRLQSQLLSRSNAICEKHKGQIHAVASGANLNLGLATTLFAGAGAIANGHAAQQAYSAVAAATNASRGLVNEQIYHQQYVGTVTSAIDAARERKRESIDARQLLPLSRYSVDDAVRDAQDYHFQCSFYFGMQELKDAIADRRAKEPTRIDATINDLSSRIATLKSDLTAAAYDKDLSQQLRLQIQELVAERHRLQLRKAEH